MAQVKRGPIAILVILLVGGLLFGARYAINHNWVPGLKTVESSIPEADRDLRDYKSDSAKVETTLISNTNIVLPTNEVTGQDFPEVRVKFWAWNGHMTIIYANGGPVTTRGSLMEKYGVKVLLERQDDTNQLRDELFKCASQLANGQRDCSSGIHLTTLMGDQLGAQLAGWNEQFRKLGEDLIIEFVGLGGRSDGEDAFLAPPTVKIDPQNARGLVVAAAPREGDQNIVFFYADQNDIPINVDQRTYDPDAINFRDANTYTQAAELYNSKSCESRAEVKKGVRTGKTVQACVNALTTWTPADVTATVGNSARGGLVRIFSTKQNSSQMPNAVLGIKRWNKDNSQTLVKFLAAMTEAGEQLRASRVALRKGAELSAQVYKEADTNFWFKYYLGAKETDVDGNEVELGGSLAFTLADNLKFFGISGGTDYFRDSYELFGGYMKRYYPNEVPRLESYDLVANKIYIKAVAKMRQVASQQQATGVVREFGRGEEITSVSARNSWSIEFETGQATFTPSATRTLEELRRVLSIAQNELVKIEGHTDSVGNPEFNQSLSERRALAVKTWLQVQSRDTFPDNRLRVGGFGQNRPVADNNTTEGRARNRRVEIVLGR